MSTSVVMTLAITTIILLSIAIFPSAFWARYLPHASLLPLLAIMLSYQFKQRGMPLVQFYLALNLYLIASIHFPYIQSSNVRARSKLAAVASSKKNQKSSSKLSHQVTSDLTNLGLNMFLWLKRANATMGFLWKN